MDFLMRYLYKMMLISVKRRKLEDEAQILYRIALYIVIGSEEVGKRRSTFAKMRARHGTIVFLKIVISESTERQVYHVVI